MNEDELSQAIRDIYGELNSIKSALIKIVELEANNTYMNKMLIAYQERLAVVEKELSTWRVVRVVGIVIGFIAAPIFVAGVTKVLGWH